MTRLAIIGGPTDTVEITPTENGVSLFVNGVTLIVVNGLGDLTVPAPGKQLTVHHVKAPKQPAIGLDFDVTEVPPPKKRLGMPKKPHGKLNVAEDRKIIDALLEYGPLDGGRLLDRMGIDPKDPNRVLIWQRITRMRRRGVLQKHPQDTKKPINYRLVVPNPNIYLEP